MWNASPLPNWPGLTRGRRSRRGRGVLVTLAGVLVLAGCPYDGLPLAEPDAALFEPALTGDWTAADPETDWGGGRCTPADSLMSIMRFNRAEYLITVQDGDSCTREYWRAYPSRIAGALFMNVQTVKAGPRGVFETDSTAFLIVRVDLQGDRLTLRLVSESIGSPATSAELRQTLERRLDDAAVYDEEVLRLRRVPPASVRDGG